ncbi:MAG TPA: biotin/lipoyl-binding protein [Candidatus Cloacimonadota bacterium]|nr:biotin/lipoyl-binding protein [Candidatus Cloacimonadota bacterium]
MKTYRLLINGERFEARILEYTPTHAKININGHDYLVQIEEDKTFEVPKLAEQEKAVPMAPAFSSGFDPGTGEVRAPIPGVIVSIPVKEGDEVKRGQTIIIIEAMKMESEIASPVDAKIAKINIKERSLVQEGDILMLLEGVEIKTKPAAKPTRSHSPAQADASPAAVDSILRAPIPGTILDVKVKAGDIVQDGDVALVLEAMKMESDIHFQKGGRVLKVHVARGDSVQESDPLIELEA